MASSSAAGAGASTPGEVGAGASTPGGFAVKVAVWNVGLPDADSFAKNIDAAINKAIDGMFMFQEAGVDIVGINELHPEHWNNFVGKLELRTTYSFVATNPGDALLWRRLGEGGGTRAEAVSFREGVGRGQGS